MKNKLLIGTRKGLVVYKKGKHSWTITAVYFNGVPVSLAYEDERNGEWYACLDHGHWGVKLHKSCDKGQRWEELEAPAYPEGYFIKENIPVRTAPVARPFFNPYVSMM